MSCLWLTTNKHRKTIPTHFSIALNPVSMFDILVGRIPPENSETFNLPTAHVKHRWLTSVQ